MSAWHVPVSIWHALCEAQGLGEYQIYEYEYNDNNKHKHNDSDSVIFSMMMKLKEAMEFVITSHVPYGQINQLGNFPLW